MAAANAVDLALSNCWLQSTNIDARSTSTAAESAHDTSHLHSVLESHAPAQSLRTFATIGKAMCIPDAHNPIPVSARMTSTQVAR